MALTAEQIETLKFMMREAMKMNQAAFIDAIVQLLNATQKEVAYDNLRTLLLNKIEQRITAAQQRYLSAQEERNTFPPRV